MTFTKSVAGMIPGLMSLSLVSHTAKMIPQDWSPKGMKQVGPGKMIKGFVPIIVGVPMIGQVSTSVAAL